MFRVRAGETGLLAPCAAHVCMYKREAVQAGGVTHDGTLHTPRRGAARRSSRREKAQRKSLPCSPACNAPQCRSLRSLEAQSGGKPTKCTKRHKARGALTLAIKQPLPSPPPPPGVNLSRCDFPLT